MGLRGRGEGRRLGLGRGRGRLTLRPRDGRGDNSRPRDLPLCALLKSNSRIPTKNSTKMVVVFIFEMMNKVAWIWSMSLENKVLRKIFD